MKDKHEVELKADPKAEALLKATMDLRPDLKEDDVRFVFNLGAVYGAGRTVEKATAMVEAFLRARLKRASEGGEA